MVVVPVGLVKEPPQLEVHWYVKVMPANGEVATTFSPVMVELPAICWPALIPVMVRNGALGVVWKKLKLKNALCAATSLAVPLLRLCEASYIT